jgi:hypothetical protein
MSAYLKTELKVKTMVSHGNEGDRREFLSGKNAYAIHINCTKKEISIHLAGYRCWLMSAAVSPC